jgi:hypothetical protein
MQATPTAMNAWSHGTTKTKVRPLKKNPENKTSIMQYYSEPNCRKIYKEEKRSQLGKHSLIRATHNEDDIPSLNVLFLASCLTAIQSH